LRKKKIGKAQIAQGKQIRKEQIAQLFSKIKLNANCAKIEKNG